jgi:hypothetical protein
LGATGEDAAMSSYDERLNGITEDEEAFRYPRPYHDQLHEILETPFHALNHGQDRDSDGASSDTRLPLAVSS